MLYCVQAQRCSRIQSMVTLMLFWILSQLYAYFHTTQRLRMSGRRSSPHMPHSVTNAPHCVVQPPDHTLRNLRKLRNLRLLSQVSEGRSTFLKVSIWSQFSYSRSGIAFFSQGRETYLFSYGVSECSQGRSDFFAVGKLRDFSGCDAILLVWVKMNDMRNRKAWAGIPAKSFL